MSNPAENSVNKINAFRLTLAQQNANLILILLLDL